MKPSTPRGLPVPRSNAAARSRNSPQCTQRLSIQNEGGCRLTARCRGVDGASCWRTCHWGGCSKIIATFRGYVGGQWRRGAWLTCSLPLIANEGNRRAWGPVPSPPSGSVGQSMGSAGLPRCQSATGTWPQLPIESAGLLACPTQGVVLEAQQTGAAADTGIAFLARPVGRPG